MSTAPRKILCVEDQPETCELISKILRDFEVISANTVEDAVEHIRETRFDLILLDYYLPDGTGIELCNRIRFIDKKTPIVFVTGTSGITDEEISEASAQGMIKKASVDFTEKLMTFAESLSSNTAPASTSP